MNEEVSNWRPRTNMDVDAELRDLQETIRLLQEENKKLRAENAGLREKYMTRFERIQKASAEELASTLMHIYMGGYSDGVDRVSREPIDTYWLNWLQEMGTI